MSETVQGGTGRATPRSAPGRGRGLLGLALAVVLGLAGVVAAPPVTSGAVEAQLTVNGRGWGHGRGMSQYGAYGYAVDHGWGFAQILDHYYGGTTAGTVPNSVITVELLSMNGRPLVVTGRQLRVNGAAVGAAARLTLQPDNSVRVESGTGCVSATWTPVPGTFTGNATRVTSAVPQSTLDDLVGICEATGVRAYRGSLSVVNSGGTQMTINHVRVESYLRGVVPRESPASWGSAGGGRGLEALKAQSVAARSYALASRRPVTGATTCDTTACQVYRGAGFRTAGWENLEAAATNQAIAATSGLVRLRAGVPVRTEFSSSSGGWTAGGVFPAVRDDGDDTSINPNRSWTVSMPMSTVAARLGTGSIRSIAVTGRNGLGADGGRVTSVRVVTESGATRTFTGAAVRSALGLKSDWFVLSGVTDAEARAVVRALYRDILGRAADAGGLTHWTSEIHRTGDARVVARGIVLSTERLHTFVRAEYSAALGRAPEAAGLAHWTRFLQAGASVPELQVFIYASDEALLNLGGGDLGRWVNGVYAGILGRQATTGDRAHWVGIARAQGRPAVVRAIAMSDEAGLRRLDRYYRTMLGRAPDPTGIATYLPLMRGNGDFLLPIEIGGSAEYWARAQTR